MSGQGIVLAPNGTRANVDPFYNYKLPTEEDLPPGWSRKLASPTDAAYYNTKRKLRVLLSIMQCGTTGEWIHLSYSHAKRTPNHDATALVKKLFIGDNREAIAVFPPKSSYVNIMPHCLHLWCPLDPRDKRWPRFEKFIDGVGITI